MPTINKRFIPYRRKTLTEALVEAHNHPNEDMGVTGINHYLDPPEEGEWARVQRLRQEMKEDKESNKNRAGQLKRYGNDIVTRKFGV